VEALRVAGLPPLQRSRLWDPSEVDCPHWQFMGNRYPVAESACRRIRISPFVKAVVVFAEEAK
jgi:hypothetical protein